MLYWMHIEHALPSMIISLITEYTRQPLQCRSIGFVKDSEIPRNSPVLRSSWMFNNFNSIQVLITASHICMQPTTKWGACFLFSNLVCFDGFDKSHGRALRRISISQKKATRTVKLKLFLKNPLHPSLGIQLRWGKIWAAACKVLLHVSFFSKSCKNPLVWL